MTKEPTCEECGEPIEPPARAKLGYRTCLECAEATPPPTRTVAIPYNKGPYQLVPLADIKDIGR